MDRRSFLRKAAVGGTTTAAASALAAPLYAQGKRTLTLVASWSRGLAGVHDAAERISQLITELTDGQLTVEHNAAGELVGALDVFDAVSTGEADMYHSADFYYMKKHPAYAFYTTVPFGMSPLEAMNWYYHSGGRELHDEISKQFNLKTFWSGDTGPQAGGWFRTEISGPEDFNGLKIRMPGLGGVALGKLGALAINVPGGQLYQALATDELDAAEWIGPWADEKVGFQEIRKVYYPAGFQEPAGGLSLGINREVFESFTPAQQKIVETASSENHRWSLTQFLSQNSAALIRMRDAGVKIREYPDTVWNALGSVSNEVHQDNFGNELYKRVYDSYIESLRSSAEWLTRSEGTYRTQRDRVLG